jgi:signal transduction histidine kinase
LTRAHGGELTLVSTTGSGTVFRLTLPAPSHSRDQSSANVIALR